MPRAVKGKWGATSTLRLLNLDIVAPTCVGGAEQMDAARFNTVE
jgi:hypothetical protein